MAVGENLVRQLIELENDCSQVMKRPFGVSLGIGMLMTLLSVLTVTSSASKICCTLVAQAERYVPGLVAIS
jgi:hypothetical protein